MLELLSAAVFIVAAAAALLTWRLSTGPLELQWLARQMAEAVSADSGIRLSIGGAALAWEGYRAGADAPLDIRLTDVTATTTDGTRLASIPRAEVTLSLGRLLLGQIVPRSIAVDGARLRVLRADNGAVTLNLGGLDEPPDASGGDGLPARLLSEMVKPPTSDHGPARESRWSQLRRLRLRDAEITVVDRQLGLVWSVPQLALEAHRAPRGGLQAEGQATARLADLTASATVRGTLDAGSGRISLSAQLSPLNPAQVAAAIPQAVALAALDAPVTLSGTLELDAALQPGAMTARADIGGGVIHVGQGQMPLLGATLSAAGTARQAQVTLARLDLAPRPDGPRTQLTGQALLARDASGVLTADLTLNLDRLAFADLPALWPKGVGGSGARPWITQNITEGIMHDGHVEAGARIATDGSGLTLTRVAGGIAGDGLTVAWLRPVPPLEKVAARLNLVSPDALEVLVSGGRQAGGGQGGIQVQSGRVLISDLNGHDQFADIDAQLSGPVADVLTLLRHPRIKLLDRSPLQLRDAGGEIAGRVSVTHLPLRDAVTMDDVQIRAATRLTNLRAPGIAVGRDLDHGALTLSADPDGLHAAGTAEVAGIPAKLRLDMDFRAGAPTQVTQRVSVEATATARQLAGLGLDTQGVVDGPAAMTADVALQRGGAGDVQLHADLAQATLRLQALGFRKPPDQPAELSAHVALAAGRITMIDHVHMEGSALRLDAEARFADGTPEVVRLTRVMLDDALDASGEIHPPRRKQDPWVARLTGRSIDIGQQLARRPTSAEPANAKGPAWRIEAQFDQVKLGPGRMVAGVELRAENDGTIINRLALSGRTGEREPFEVTIEPRGTGRVLAGSAANAGALLRALDVMGTMLGGRLAVHGAFDDARADHLLDGTLSISDPRIRNAPVLARLLEAMTLYGLVEMARGPGLGFTQMVVPFHYADNQLDLIDARAHNASLGITARGRIDLGRQTADLRGTIVPAYAVNSLLGDIPLVGKLFSPERGGGLLAATYTVRGPLDDPSVGVNPLSALTPGALRGLFSVFNTPPPAPN